MVLALTHLVFFAEASTHPLPAFLRGLFYFHQVLLFGDVPIITEPADAATEMVFKPKAEAYALVVKDATEAEWVAAGGVLDVEYGKLNLELIAGVTPVRTVDIDSSRPGFDFNTRRGFFGALGGYCGGQSGMLMAASALLAENENPSDAAIDAAITNICRCGTYQRVKAAILRAAGAKA